MAVRYRERISVKVSKAVLLMVSCLCLGVTGCSLARLKSNKSVCQPYSIISARFRSNRGAFRLAINRH